MSLLKSCKGENVRMLAPILAAYVRCYFLSDLYARR